jgi:hypothetical protein
MQGMPAPLHTPWAVQADRSHLVLLAFCGAFASAAVGAVFVASWLWLPLTIVAAAAIGIVAFRHTIAFCVVWLLLAGATLEMALADLVGPAAFETTIAVVKSAELGPPCCVSSVTDSAWMCSIRPWLSWRCLRQAWCSACILA